jgi:hypothetical protein
MRHLTLSGSVALPREFGEYTPSDPLTLRSMVNAPVHLCDGTVQHNADQDWDTFSSDEYWRCNYAKLQARRTRKSSTGSTLSSADSSTVATAPGGRSTSAREQTSTQPC